MTDALPFNLNDEKQFPFLNGVLKFLDTFTPYHHLDLYALKKYDPIKYNGEIDENAETLEQSEKDIVFLIGKVKRAMFDMIDSPKTLNYINNLLKERDRFSINISGKEQREYNIQTYNSYVIQDVERYTKFLQERLEITFHPYFKQPEKDRLNLPPFFTGWYEKFGTKEEIENIEVYSQPIKLKWLGNASHLGNLIYQLADKGYIEFPLYRSERNYTALAERLLNAFEFKDKNPSKKYLSEQINPESENNKISKATEMKLKLNIPPLEDLT